MFYWVCYILVIPVFRLLFRVRVTGREHIPPGAVLICGNHTALLDPFFLAMVMGPARPLNFLAKAELFRVPVLNTLIRWLGAFPVERGQSDIGAVRQAVSVLQKGGQLIIFPDGHRVRRRGEYPLQMGAAMISVRAGAPVLPVYMSFPKKPFRRTHVVVGPALYTQPVKGGSSEHYRTLTARIDEAIWSLEPSL